MAHGGAATAAATAAAAFALASAAALLPGAMAARLPGASAAAALSAAAAGAHAGAPPTAGGLYGITHEPAALCNATVLPACTALVRVDAASGAVTRVGVGTDVVGTYGDEAAAVGGVYYFLGDGGHGDTNVVGLNLTDGGEVCRRTLGLPEVGIVGGGQSLSADAGNGGLVVSAIVNATGGHMHHVVLRVPVAAHPCGGEDPLEYIGTFEGAADYEPMAHATEFDAVGQRLFITVAADQIDFALIEVDVSPGGGAAPGAVAVRRVWPFGGDAGAQQLWGMHYFAGDGGAGQLRGVQENPQNTGLDWRTLDVGAEGGWVSQPLKNDVTADPLHVIYGNLGSVRAFDPATGTYFALAGPGKSQDEAPWIVSVDSAKGAVTAAAQQSGDLGTSGDGAMQLVWVPAQAS